jgi:hypothetical protein
VRRLSLLLVLSTCLACSDHSARSGALPQQADFLPSITKAAPETLAASEEPRLLLRCEQGRMGAYLVVGTDIDSEPGQPQLNAVAVALDSAPPC